MDASEEVSGLTVDLLLERKALTMMLEDKE